MATLSLSLLGPFEASLNNHRLTKFRTSKVQALLIYLAVEAIGRPAAIHRREALMELLWPGLPLKSAQENLRQTLYQLRKAIPEVESGGSGSGTFIVADRQTVQINPEAVYDLDVARFTDLVTKHPQPGELVQAANLYRGDFLADFYLSDSNEFENWVSLRRAHLRHQMLDTLDRLTTILTSQENYGQAEGYARRQIELDNLRESAHRQLMIILTRSGRRRQALAQYETWHQLLQSELGVSPSTETKALVDAIRDERLSTTRLTRETPDPDLLEVGDMALDSSPQGTPLATLLNTKIELDEAESNVFIGRQRELSHLTGLLEKVLRGQGRVVFVIGEAGWGKTSLLHEFSRRAQEVAPKLIAVNGICDVYTGVGDPYQPFREIMGMLTGDIESQTTASTIGRDHALRLWHLLPQSIRAIIDWGPDLIDTVVSGTALLSSISRHGENLTQLLVDLEAARARQMAMGAAPRTDQSSIFEQYTAVLNNLAKEQPLLLLLDDLQWADLSSVGLLSYIGRRLADSPVLIIGAYRPEEVAQGRQGDQHPLASILSEFKRNFGDIWIELDRADSTKGREFVDALLDTETNRLGEAFREALSRHTEGHPLFTRELLRDMQARGQLWQDEDGLWVVSPDLVRDVFPPRVEGVIEKRLNHLDPELREMLRTASVEGESFTAEVIARIHDTDARRLVQRLSSEADKRHRLVFATGVRQGGSSGSRLSRYRFRHNLFQKYLYQSLDDVERAYQHEAVGIVLEALYADKTDEIAGQLARHFQEAGLISRGMAYFQVAGDTAARVFAHTESAIHYGRALVLAKGSGAGQEQLTYLYVQLGRVLELDSKFEAALANYEDMRSLGHQRGEPSLELAALIALGTLYTLKGPVMDQARAVLLSEQALGLARELADQLAEAKILWNLSNLHRVITASQAIEHGERSVALARQLNLAEQLAFSLNDLALAYVRNGPFDRAKQLLAEACELWRELDNPPMLANSLSASTCVHIHSGQYEEAVSLSDEAYHISQSTDNIWGQSYSLYMIGCVYWDWGQPDRAIAVMKESVRLSEMAGFLAPQTICRAWLAAVYGSLGAIEQGLEIARHGLAVAQEVTEDIASPFNPAALAQLYLLDDDLEKAEAAVDLGKEDFSWDDFDIYHVYLPLVEIELVLQRGDGDRALLLTEKLLGKLRQYRANTYLPNALYLQAQALLGLGRENEAQNSLVEARSSAEVIGSQRMLWKILALLASVEGDPPEAKRLRHQAREIVDYISEHIGDPELKASFLSLPQVQTVT